MSTTRQAAEGLEKKGDWKGALALYQQIYDADENGDIEALKKIGWCQSKVGLFAEAAATFKELVTIEPRVAKWFYLAGAQYYSLKQWATAVEWLRKALVLMPDYLVAKHKCACAVMEMAGDECSVQNVDFLEASAQLDGCRALWRKMSPEQQQRNTVIAADVFMRRGKQLLRRKEYAQAVASLKQAIELVPGAWESQYQLARAYSEHGDQSAALLALPDAKRPFVQELKVLILIRKGETEKGLELLKECVRNRQRDYLMNEIAEIFLQQKDINAAFSYAARAVAVQPSNHKFHFCLARVFRAARLLLSAKKEAQAAVKLMQENLNQVYEDAAAFLSRLEQEIAAKKYTQDNAAALQLLQKGQWQVDPVETKSSVETKPARYEKANYKEARGAGRTRTGVIQSFDESKGYGFLVCSQNGKSFYFHMKEFPEAQFAPVRVGMEVAFELKKTPKGLAAVKIALVK